MYTSDELYKKIVLDDLETYRDLAHPVKAGTLERMLIRHARLNRLHPNPDDEFSMPEIGPSFEIISNYEAQFRDSINLGKPLMKPPLIVEKISTGGYMLLNGHHRWYAASRMKVRKKVGISIVNSIPKEEILSKINHSTRSLCVSFDLDEVLMTDRKRVPAEDEPFYMKWFYKNTLRKNTGALISTLQRAGFDVWIYTSNPHSEAYIKKLFSRHHASVDGVINCVTNRKFGSEIKSTFCEKYSYIVHIDNESVLWVDTKTKEFDSIELGIHGKSWAARTWNCIEKLPFMKQRNTEARS